MSEKFNARYRVQTVRMPNWDYGWKGDYFVTVKTWNRIHFFGEIINGEMHLNEIGQILHNEWHKTPFLRSDMNITLGEFIVMPNHFHGIISIGRNPYNQYDGGDDGSQKQFGPQSKNLASIIRGLKSSVTIQARKINPDFKWQPGFHERLIRDVDAYNQIAKYIRENVQNWGKPKG